MTVKAVVTEDEYKALSDPLKAEYGDADSDGNRQLSVEATSGYGLFRDPTTLRTEIETKNREITTLTGERDRFKSDFDKANADLEAEKGRKAGKSEEEITRLIDQKLREQKELNDQALEAEKQKREDADSKFRNAMAQAAIAAACGEKEVQGSAPLLIPHVLPQVITEVGEDGQVKHYISDGKGGKRISANPADDGSSQLMGLKEFLVGLRKDPTLGRAFSPVRKSGPGDTEGDFETSDGTSIAEQVRAVADKNSKTFNLSKLGDLYRKHPETVKPIAAEYGLQL